VTDWLPEVLAEYPRARIITANGGLWLFARDQAAPHYCVVFDPDAVMMLHDVILAAQAAGCRMIVPSFRMGVICHYRPITPDIILEMVPEERYEYARGQTVNCRMSGLLACQFALQEGADELVLVGMDGYTARADPAVDTFDGRLQIMGRRITSERVVPFMRTMIEAEPRVRFRQYGNPTFTIEAPNYEVIA
jgi:hypothetical protein